MESNEHEEVLIKHRIFLSLIAVATHLRADYTPKALKLFKDELNVVYEETRKKLDEELVDQEPLIRKKAFSRAQHKLIDKPFSEKYKAEQKINRILTEVIDQTIADGNTILLTQVIQELCRAKDLRDVVTLLVMYNKGNFEQIFKKIKENENSKIITNNMPVNDISSSSAT